MARLQPNDIIRTEFQYGTLYCLFSLKKSRDTYFKETQHLVNRFERNTIVLPYNLQIISMVQNKMLNYNNLRANCRSLVRIKCFKWSSNLINKE